MKPLELEASQGTFDTRGNLASDCYTLASVAFCAPSSAWPVNLKNLNRARATGPWIGTRWLRNRAMRPAAMTKDSKTNISTYIASPVMACAFQKNRCGLTAQS